MSRSTEISAELTHEQFRFLEDFERRCNETNNPGISKASILRCLLRLFHEVNIKIDPQGANTEEALLSQLLTAAKEAHRY